MGPFYLSFVLEVFTFRLGSRWTARIRVYNHRLACTALLMDVTPESLDDSTLRRWRTFHILSVDEVLSDFLVPSSIAREPFRYSCCS